MIFFSILMVFWSLLNFGAILAQQQQFISKIYIYIFFVTQAIPEAVKVVVREE